MTAWSDISEVPTKNQDFINKLLSVCPDDLRPLMCSFPQSPDKGRWGARLLNDSILEKLYSDGNSNRYTTISVFEGDKRRKTEFVAMVAVMIDDPGTKVPIEKIALPPTYWLETSPDNFQAWYMLSEPVTDRLTAESVLSALVASGLANDGKDPGMKGVTRYGRLPGGFNNKKSLESPHRVRAYEDLRGCNLYTIDQILDAYDLDIEPFKEEGYQSTGSVDFFDAILAEQDPVYKLLYDLGLIKYKDVDKWQLVCPWIDDHTDGVDNGSALMIRQDGGLGFKCHHGHCQDKTLTDIHNWLKENHPKEYAEVYGSKPDPDNEESLETAIKDFLETGPSNAAIELEIPNLADDFAVSPYNIRSIINAINDEKTEVEELETIDLEAITAAAKNTLSLRLAFPEELADAIQSKCESDRLDPIRPTQSVIPMLSAQLGARTTIVVKPAIGDGNAWREYPHNSCVDVGYPSEGKSQTNNTVIAPLVYQQSVEYSEYRQRLDFYKNQCDVARQSNSNEPEKPKPPPKRYITGGTTEGIMKRISELPQANGMFYVCDEFAGLLSADQYKKGGNFKNVLLTALSSPLKGTEERSNGDNEELAFKKQTLCITGSIQPGRVKQLFDPDSDDSGFGSRFLWAYPNLPDDFSKWSNVEVNITEELSGLIQYLQGVGEGDEDPIDCLMDRQTQKRFISRFEAFRAIQENKRESNTGLASFIGKCPGHLARLTLLAHWVATYYEEESPGEITSVSFSRACHLLDYYIGQFRLLQVAVGADDSLSKSHLYVSKRLNKLPVGKSLTVRQIYQGMRGLKKKNGSLSMDQVRVLFKSFDNRGIASYDPDKQTLTKC